MGTFLVSIPQVERPLWKFVEETCRRVELNLLQNCGKEMHRSKK
jgi:hypothetical protein